MQSPPPVDVNTMSAQDVDAALAALGITASKRTVFNRMAAGLSPEMTNYIATLRNDPAALKKFVEQLKARKASLATTPPTTPPTMPQAAASSVTPPPAAPSSEASSATPAPVSAPTATASPAPQVSAPTASPVQQPAQTTTVQQSQPEPQPQQQQPVPPVIRGPKGWVKNPAYKGKAQAKPGTKASLADDFPIIES